MFVLYRHLLLKADENKSELLNEKVDYLHKIMNTLYNGFGSETLKNQITQDLEIVIKDTIQMRKTFIDADAMKVREATSDEQKAQLFLDMVVAMNDLKYALLDNENETKYFIPIFQKEFDYLSSAINSLYNEFSSEVKDLVAPKN